MREPVGVIGLLCAGRRAASGAVSLLAPAIAMGNRVVLVPSWPAPLAATDLYQVLDTSDVPGGVVNIVTGDPGELGRHARVPSRRGCALVLLAAGRCKSDRGGLGRKPQAHLDQPRRQPRLDVGRGRGRRFLDAATEVKTIWVPYGE
jgi:aldehyde dehydrogenase (NAD+)